MTQHYNNNNSNNGQPPVILGPGLNSHPIRRKQVRWFLLNYYYNYSRKYLNRHSELLPWNFLLLVTNIPRTRHQFCSYYFFTFIAPTRELIYKLNATTMRNLVLISILLIDIKLYFITIRFILNIRELKLLWQTRKYTTNVCIFGNIYDRYFKAMSKLCQEDR